MSCCGHHYLWEIELECSWSKKLRCYPFGGNWIKALQISKFLWEIMVHPRNQGVIFCKSKCNWSKKFCPIQEFIIFFWRKLDKNVKFIQEIMLHPKMCRFIQDKALSFWIKVQFIQEIIMLHPKIHYLLEEVKSKWNYQYEIKKLCFIQKCAGLSKTRLSRQQASRNIILARWSRICFGEIIFWSFVQRAWSLHLP